MITAHLFSLKGNLVPQKREKSTTGLPSLVPLTPNPSSCLIKPPIFKEIFVCPDSRRKTTFHYDGFRMGQTPPHLKNFCLGGLSNFETLPFGKLFSSAGMFGFLLFFNRETIRGHGPTIAEPCLPYCGGGGGGGPPN